MSLLRSCSLFARLAVLSGCSALSFVSARAVQNATLGSWYPIGFGGGGFMMSVTTFPTSGSGPYNVLTGCDSSAGFISSDAGGAWTQLAEPTLMGGTKQDGKNVFVTAEFDPADATGRNVFMAEGSTMYWVHQSNGIYAYDPVLANAVGGISSICFALDNPAVVFASTGGVRPFLNSGFGRTLGSTLYPANIPVIYKAGNGGRSASDWDGGTYLFPNDHTKKGTIFRVVAVTSGSTGRAYAATDVGLFSTGNGGTSWSKIGTGGLHPLPHDVTFGLAVVPGSSASTDKLYVTLQPYADLQGYLADPQGYVDAHPNNAGGLFYSPDGGATWSQCALGVSNPGGLWADAGHVFDVAVSSLNPQRIYVAYQQGDETNMGGTTNDSDKSGVLRSTDGGSSFAMLNVYSKADATQDDIYISSFLPQRLAVHAISAAQEEVFVMGVEAGQFKGTEGASGMTFSNLSSTAVKATDIINPQGTPDAYFRGWGLEAHLGGRMAIDPNEPSVYYYNDKDRGFWKSIDFGQSYRYLYNPGLGDQGDGRGCFPDPDNSSIVYGYIGRKDYRLANTGNAHFVTSKYAGEPDPNNPGFETGWNQTALTQVADLFVWDVALDPTVLAAPDVETQRKLTLAAGDGPFSPFKIVAHVGTQKYDVYLSFDQLNKTPLKFTDSAAADVAKVELSLQDDAGTLYVDSFALSASGPIETQNFDATLPNDWVPSGDAGYAADWKGNFSSPTGGAIRLMNAANGAVKLSHSFTKIDAGDATINIQLLPWDVATGKTYACKLYDSQNHIVASVRITDGEVWADTRDENGNPSSTDLKTAVRAPSDHIGVYQRTSDGAGGFTWTDLADQTGMAQTACLRQLELDPSDPTTIFALDTNYHGALYKYTDNHNGTGSWSVQRQADQQRAFAVIPYNGGNLLVVAQSSDDGTSRLYRQFPGTQTWDDLAATQLGTGQVYVCLTRFGDTGLYLGTSNGVKYIADITQATIALTDVVDVNDSLGYGSIYNLDLISNAYGQSLFAGRPGSGSMRADFLPFMVKKYRRYDAAALDFLDDQRYFPQKALDGFRSYPDASWQVPELPATLGAAKEHLYAMTTADSDRTSTAAGTSATNSLAKLITDHDVDVYVAVASTISAPTWIDSRFALVPQGTFDLQKRNTATTQGMTLYATTLAANATLLLGGASANNASQTAPVNYLVFATPSPAVKATFETGDTTTWTTTGTWTVVADLGSNHCYKASSSSTESLALAVASAVADSSIEASVKSANWGTDCSVGLVTRDDGAGNYYRFVYVPGATNSDGTLGEVRIVRQRGVDKTVLLAAPYTATLNGSDFHRFGFSVKDEQLLGYIDGKIVLSTTDRSALKIQSGTSGLFSKKNDTLFDDYHQFLY